MGGRSWLIPSFILALTLPALGAGLSGGNAGDVTGAFQAAVNATPPGGILTIPPGQYQLSATINITKPITIVGSGFGTQIFEKSDTTLVRFTGVNNAVLSNMYLGSAAVTAGTSLIELVNSNHNRLDNITLLGSYYGLHLQGSLLNTVIDLRSGTNFQGFFGSTSSNKYWIYAEPYKSISANANTFIAPVLEGGVNGISLNDNTGQGSLTITGGTIEGVSGVGLAFNTTFLPSTVTGTHFEANGVSDINIASSSNITLDTILSLKNINITRGRNILIKWRNCRKFID